MKNNTVKNLVNQVKKALANKSSFSAFERAYADNNGNLIARSMDHNADIYIFVAGIVEALEAQNKVYTKDALTLAADTGIFKGGSELPENCQDFYNLPVEDFTKVCEIPADDLKAAAYTASKDGSRAVLTGLHLTPGGKLESCDGFRAYRKRIPMLNEDALNDFEKVNGLLLSAAAAAYGFKGNVEIYAGNNYLRLEDESGLTMFVRKLAGQYVNMDAIFVNNYKVSNVATIKDKKAITAALKTAKAVQSKADRNERGIYIRFRRDFLDYYIPALDVFGSVEAKTEAIDTDFFILLNPAFLYDAIINQNCITIETQPSKHAPVFISGSDYNKALVLPIRDDGGNPFENYHPDTAATTAAPDPEPTPEKEAEAIRTLNEKQHAENHYTNIGKEEIKAEIERQEADAAAEQEAPTEAEAPAENIAKQAAEKLEIVKREIVKNTPPEVIKAREFYKQLRACNFTPTEYQEADAEIIYKNNKSVLQPIAKQAGGLYIDTLSIIAAIMSIYDN